MNKESGPEIAENIVPILDQLVSAYGTIQVNKFIHLCKAAMVMQDIKSPIEQVLLVALAVECTRTDPGNILKITPQYEYEKYRADFMVCNTVSMRKFIVECDGQSFHDSTEEQRRYEKKRDRFFQKNGFQVFRYTGREILQKPLDIASEIVTFGLSLED